MTISNFRRGNKNGFNHYRHSGKNQNETLVAAAAIKTANSTIFIAVLTFILAAVGVFQYIVVQGQLDEMKTASSLVKAQLDAMIAQQRPWISATVEIVDPINFIEWNGQDSISVPLQISLKNFGPSPASNINIQYRIWPHPGNSNASKLNIEQDELCNNAEKLSAEASMTGVSVFPNEPKIVSTNMTTNLSTDKPTLFSVNGCIDYTYAGNMHGKTGFRMLLGKVIGSQVLGLPFIKGTPTKDYHPSPELLAKGYPPRAPTRALLYPGNYYFKTVDGGNFAK